MHGREAELSREHDVIIFEKFGISYTFTLTIAQYFNVIKYNT